MCLFIGSFHPYMGLLAAAAFFCVGVAVPLIISKVSGNTGDEIRGQSGELAAPMRQTWEPQLFIQPMYHRA